MSDQVQALDQRGVIVSAPDAIEQSGKAGTAFGGFCTDNRVVTMNSDDIPTTISGELPEVACLFVGSK
jgi:hypothetical protein